MSALSLRDKLAEKGYYNTRYVADKVGVKTVLVYKWIKEGKIATKVVAGKKYIEWASVANFVGDLADKVL